MPYCYLCNTQTGNAWVCNPCVRTRSPFSYSHLFSELPVRMTPQDSIPDEITRLFGDPLLDPDLRLAEGI